MNSPSLESDILADLQQTESKHCVLADFEIHMKLQHVSALKPKKWEMKDHPQAKSVASPGVLLLKPDPGSLDQSHLRWHFPQSIARLPSHQSWGTMLCQPRSARLGAQNKGARSPTLVGTSMLLRAPQIQFSATLQEPKITTSFVQDFSTCYSEIGYPGPSGETKINLGQPGGEFIPWCSVGNEWVEE